MEEQGYQLIDSGHFRKLEQIGPFRIVRPSPQAVWAPRLPESEWQQSIAATYTRFSGGDGKWRFQDRAFRDGCIIYYGQLTFSIKPTEFGHLGLFAEQIENWQRIRALIARHVAEHEETFRVLNLFAYTGASTLAASQAGAEVVHVDASKTSVSWAREHAELNQLSERPVRWIVDDVSKFVAREVRREQHYHGIILDPPSFGRGAKNEVWKIEEHLLPLMEQLRQIAAPNFSFLMLSSHSNGYTPKALQNIATSYFHDMVADPQYHLDEMLVFEAQTKRALPSGASCTLYNGPAL